MSCTIGISDDPDDIWIIRNAVFRWLNRILQTRFPQDTEVLEAMRHAEYSGGISLDLTRTEDPALADRIVASLLLLSREIADGKHALLDDHSRPWPELQEQCEGSFEQLHQILKRWRGANNRLEGFRR